VSRSRGSSLHRPPLRHRFPARNALSRGFTRPRQATTSHIRNYRKFGIRSQQYLIINGLEKDHLHDVTEWSARRRIRPQARGRNRSKSCPTDAPPKKRVPPRNRATGGMRAADSTRRCRPVNGPTCGPHPRSDHDAWKSVALRQPARVSAPRSYPPRQSSPDGRAITRDQNPSRSIRLRSSLRARRTASAASRARRSDGFS